MLNFLCLGSTWRVYLVTSDTTDIIEPLLSFCMLVNWSVMEKEASEENEDGGELTLVSMWHSTMLKALKVCFTLSFFLIVYRFQ